MGRQLGVRKGAWTQEEDLLLRKFIEKYGEGKWNLVPQRAGLNRCRKSCRLRWLNHLTPNIKRGEFDDDEIDLIIRLHKLLGNRWSLIAGRIPGRTGNDIKNYWNSHLSKKVNSHDKQEIAKASYAKVLKPQPKRLSKSLISSGNLEASRRKDGGGEPLLALDNDAIWWKGLFEKEGEYGPLGSADAMRELLVIPAIDNGDAERIRDENSTSAEDCQEWDDLILDPSLWVQLEGNCLVDT